MSTLINYILVVYLDIMKKIWLFVISFIAIISFWVSFADIIPDNSHYLKRCSNLKNVEIGKYKVVYTYIYENWPDWCWAGPVNLCPQEKAELIWKVSEYSMGTCLPVWDMKIYLLDEKENINLLTQDNIDKNAIYLWNVVVKKSGYVDNSNPLTNETITYKIVNNWNDYKLIKESEDRVESETPFKCDGCVEIEDTIENGNFIENVDEKFLLENNNWKDFSIAWILTILIETVVLFVIFWKKDYIPNLRILLVWIFASTITLPLLRFVLPLFIKGGLEYTVIWESLVTLIEIFIIKYWLKISWWKAILVSILCNLCSYILGIIIF